MSTSETDILAGGLVPSPETASDPVTRVRRTAQRLNISPDIADDYLNLTGKVESGNRQFTASGAVLTGPPTRRTGAKALGMGQVMPDAKGGTTRTIAGRTYNLADPDENVEAGLKLFAAGGADPVGRRLEYFGGARARQHYERTGQIPRGDDGFTTFQQYVQKSMGAPSRNRPQKSDSSLDDILAGGLVETSSQSPSTLQTDPKLAEMEAVARQAQGAIQPPAPQPETQPGASVAAPAPAPAPNLTPENAAWHAAWHFGPLDNKRLTRRQARVLSEAVAEDERKKAAGEQIGEPNVDYQNEMRKRAGMAPLKYNVSTQPLQFGSITLNVPFTGKSRAPHYQPNQGAGELPMLEPRRITTRTDRFRMEPTGEDRAQVEIQRRLETDPKTFGPEYEAHLLRSRASDSPRMRQDFIDFKVKEQMALKGGGNLWGGGSASNILVGEDAEKMRQGRVANMNWPEYLAQAPKSLALGVTDTAATFMKGIAVLNKEMDNLTFGAYKKETTELPAYKVGEAIQREARTALKSNPDLEQELLGQSAQTIGQVMSFVFGGWVSKAPKVATVILGSGLTAGDAYDEVRANGGTDEQAVNAGLVAGALLGPTELFGLKGAMNAITDNVKKATWRAALKQAWREGRRDIVENVLQEMGQEWGQGEITGKRRTGREIAQAGLQGAVGGGVTIPITTIANRPIKEARQIEPSADVVDNAQEAPISLPETGRAIMPESPESIAAQMDAMVNHRGSRYGVLIPKGQAAPTKIPKGHAATRTSEGVVIHPKEFVPADVREMVNNGELWGLLGHMNPDTPEATRVVVARAGVEGAGGILPGTELLSSYVIPGQEQNTIEEMRMQFAPYQPTFEVGGAETAAKTVEGRKAETTTAQPLLTDAEIVESTKTLNLPESEIREAATLPYEELERRLQQSMQQYDDAVKSGKSVSEIAYMGIDARGGLYRNLIDRALLLRTPHHSQRQKRRRRGARKGQFASGKVEIPAVQPLPQVGQAGALPGHLQESQSTITKTITNLPPAAPLKKEPSAAGPEAAQNPVPEGAASTPIAENAVSSETQKEATPLPETVLKPSVPRRSTPKLNPTTDSLERAIRSLGGVKDDGSGEVAMLKESGQRGLISANGRSAEDMAMALAESGYGKGVWWEGSLRQGDSSFSGVNANDFIAAAIEDAAGSTKHYSNAVEMDFSAEEEKHWRSQMEPKEVNQWEASQKFLKSRRAQRLLGEIADGKATKKTSRQIRDLGKQYGLDEDVLAEHIRLAGSETPESNVARSSAVSDTAREAPGSEGRSLTEEYVDKEGTLRDASGDPLFSRAFHGSPHEFDKFSTEKIGTGEGAQSYGYGLYFTDRKEIAGHYRKQNAVKASYREFENRARDAYDEFSGAGEAADDFLASPDFTPKERALLTALLDHDWLGFDYPHQAIHAALTDNLDNFDADQSLRKAVADIKESGRVYEVELAPKDDEYLLWDKPLSGQSEKIKAALDQIGVHDFAKLEPSGIGNVKYRDPNDITGSRLYRDFARALGGKKTFAKEQGGYDVPFSNEQAASEYLHSLGIRGIKYLDQGSRDVDTVERAEASLAIWQDMLVKNPDRGDAVYIRDHIATWEKRLEQAKNPTYNYVIFSDNDVEIISQPLFARATQLGLPSEGLTQQEAKPARSGDQRDRLRREDQERQEAANPERVAALKTLAEIQRRGMSVDEYARQGALFGPAPSAAEIKLLQELERGQDQPESGQSSMFSLRDLFRRRRRVEDSHIERTDNIILIGQEEQQAVLLAKRSWSQDWTGARFNPTQAKEFIESIADTKVPGGYQPALNRVRREFRRAMKAGNGSVVLTSPEALLHERFHEMSAQGSAVLTGKEKALADRHSDWSKLTDNIQFMLAAENLIQRGYEEIIPVLVEETASHIAEGRYDTLGLTRKQAIDWLTLWYESFIAHNGDTSIEVFNELATDAQEALAAAIDRHSQKAQSKGADAGVSGVQEGREKGATEGRAPPDKPLLARKSKGLKAFIGLVSRQGEVTGKSDPEWNLSHDTAGFQGRQFDRDTESWRYVEQTGKVYWTANELPDRDAQIAVENWLARRGHEVKEQALIEDLWGYNPIEEPNDESGALFSRRPKDIEPKGSAVDRLRALAESRGQNVREFKPREAPIPPPTRTAQTQPSKPTALPAPTRQKVGERSFPKTAEAAGFQGGLDRDYTILTNKESIDRAERRIERVGADRAAADLAHAEDVGAPEIAMGILLMQRFEQAGNINRAVNVAGDVARKLTQAGQTVQAASIISRLSPEGVLIHAQKILKGKPLAEETAFVLVQQVKAVSDAEKLLAEIQRLRPDIFGADGSVLPKPSESRAGGRRSARAKIGTLSDRLALLEQQARERMQARAATAQAADVDITRKSERGAARPFTVAADLGDLVIIGAAKLARRGITQAVWLAEMAKESTALGRRDLRKIYRESYEMYERERKQFLRESRERGARRHAAQQGTAEPATPRDYDRIIAERLDAQTAARKARAELAKSFDDLNKGRVIRTLENMRDVWNLSRSLITSLDLSAAGRQGKMGLVTHPKAWLRGVGRQFKALSTKQYERMISEMQLDADYKYAQRFKLKLSSIAGTEEVFQSAFTQRVPWVKLSQQAYDTMLDTLRFGWFKAMLQKYRTAGINLDDLALKEQFIKDTSLINNFTGRGGGKTLDKIGPTLSIFYFSPRFWASRLKVLSLPLDPRMYGIGENAYSKQTRVDAWKTLFGFYGLVAVQIGLARLLGGVASFDPDDEDFIFNPDSADFLKVRFGTTHVDFSAGLQTHLRVAARLAKTFYVREFQKGKPRRAPVDILSQYSRSKEAPGTALIHDLFFSNKKETEHGQVGTDFAGQPVFLLGEPGKGGLKRLESSAVAKRIAPIILQDALEGYMQGIGWKRSAAAIAMSTVGEGVNTYSPGYSEKREKWPMQKDLGRLGISVNPPQRIKPGKYEKFKAETEDEYNARRQKESEAIRRELQRLEGMSYFKRLGPQDQEREIRAAIKAGREAVRYQQPAPQRKEQSATVP